MTDVPYADLAAEHRAPPARNRLGKGSVYAIFVCWTLFAVYIYSRYSQLGDARAYLTGGYDDEAQARTYLVTQLATTIIGLVRVDVLAHLTFSLFAASGVAYLVGQARVHGPYRWPLLAILLIPSFGVWAAVVGRESLYIGLLAYFMGAMVGYFRKRSMLRWWLMVACVAGMVFIRAPFGGAMALFFLMSWMILRGPRVGLSLGVQAFLLLLLGAIACIVAWPYIDDYIANDALPKARSYFTIGSATTRMWVNIDSTRELLTSLWWTLPLSLVGPTPGEVLARPMMLPFMVSGLVVFFLLLYAIQQAFRAPSGPARKILVLAWLPATLLTLVAYVPFGVYNPGSGIRYASCFLLFFVFPWMLRSAIASMATAPAPQAHYLPYMHHHRLAESTR
jgi:cytochrome c oxidase subunit IV